MTHCESFKSTKVLYSSSYPCLRILLASAMKSCMLVPMRDKQNTATSTEEEGRGVWAMSQAVTLGLLATKSKEWTLVWGTWRDSSASPHPRSATTHVSGLE